MRAIYSPTDSAEDWRLLLADPTRQWKTGYSAKTLAHCWESADGFPASVKKVLTTRFPAVEPLLILPEHKVLLPGEGASSQCDIWVLARSGSDMISIAVEGKVAELFGPTLDEWRRHDTAGKRERLNYILGKLGLPEVPGTIRYQLLHRTVAAIVEAERFNARHAVLLVHSFGCGIDNFNDFQQFAGALDLPVNRNGLASRFLTDGNELHISWVDGEEEFLKR